MILLFEHDDEKTLLLQQTVDQITDIQSVCFNDHGFLDKDITSPYQFFADVPNDVESPLYFNQLPVPRGWEIKGDHKEAWIRDMGEVKGRILYKTYKKPRMIEVVEWYRQDKEIYRKDYYNKQGYLFKEEIYKEQKLLVTRFFDAKGSLIIVKQHTENITLLHYRQQEYTFYNDEEFLNFYLQQAKFDQSSLLINSLGMPLKLSLANTKQHILFWQEEINNDIPANMKFILNNRRGQYKVAVPNQVTLKGIIEKLDEEEKKFIYPFGYIYRYYTNIQAGKEVLIVTQSDKLDGIEEILKVNSMYQFHIAAPTVMSERLMHLNRYQNVHLYPAVNKEQLHKLLENTHIYLDINLGSEVADIMKRAYQFNLLILALEQTVHQSSYTAHIYSNIQQLITAMQKLEGEAVYKEMMKQQKEAANAWTTSKVQLQFNRLIT